MRNRDEDLSHDELLSMLHYDAESGKFTWLQRGKGVRVGSVVGYYRVGGYVSIKLKQVAYLAHRLAWFYVYGKWPDQYIDHIDRDKHNNRIINLREATVKQNTENAKTPSTNRTGYRGVFYIPNRYPNRPFVAKICHHGKCVHIGNYETAEEASSAYLSRRDQLFTHHRADLGVDTSKLTT